MVAEKEKIALFDFCETIANFQTADAFVHYVREHYGTSRMFRWKKIHQFAKRIQLIMVLSILFPKASINKRIVVWQLRGIKKSLIDKFAEEYYINIIRPNFIPVGISALATLQSDGYRIVLVSGGYDVYLNFFAKEYNIHPCDVISTTLKFKRNICCGTFAGKDCLCEEKVRQLDMRFDKDNCDSVAYSDSKSDLPMLLWANKGIVIRRVDKRNWTNNYNLEEIVWGNN